MENSKIYSDEDWLKTPLICGALSNIPVDIRWEIWENLALTNEEKVPIYKYWAEQFSGDEVTNEEIAVDGVIVFPDELDMHKPYPKVGGGSGKEERSYAITPEMYKWRSSFPSLAEQYQITGHGEGFILYGEPYTPPK